MQSLHEAKIINSRIKLTSNLIILILSIYRFPYSIYRLPEKPIRNLLRKIISQSGFESRPLCRRPISSTTEACDISRNNKHMSEERHYFTRCIKQNKLGLTKLSNINMRNYICQSCSSATRSSQEIIKIHKKLSKK